MKLLQGDALEVLRTLEAGTVQTCVTSPPYYGLRDYGVAGQIGLEETPEAYVSKLVAVFAEVRRVLKDDGTLWVVIGDSYAGSHGNGNYPQANTGMNSEAAGFVRYESPTKDIAGFKPKDLIGIPWMLAFALRADGWYLRQDIIWAKPNPMPESVTDRCTKSHEYIFLLSKSARYYMDMDAIAEASIWADDPRAESGRIHYAGKREGAARTGNENFVKITETRNRRSVWTVTTKPYKEAHFATYPPDLIEPCILAGSKVGDVVLDPFNGSGTTGAVALHHNRDYIGIELSPSYLRLTERRLSRVQRRLFA
jgi:DNA modification methylase